mgnify:CR=1 FL=1
MFASFLPHPLSLAHLFSQKPSSKGAISRRPWLRTMSPGVAGRWLAAQQNAGKYAPFFQRADDVEEQSVGLSGHAQRVGFALRGWM